MSETKKQPTYNPNSLLSDPNLPDHAKTSTSSTSSGAQTLASPEKKSTKTTTSASTATTANSASSAKSNPNSDKPITSSAATVSNSANTTGSSAAATANSTTGSTKTQPVAFRSDAAHRATTQNQNFFAEQNAKAKAKKDQRAKATKRSLIIIAIIVALLLISLTTWFVVVKISNPGTPLDDKPYDEMTEDEKAEYSANLINTLYAQALGIDPNDNDNNSSNNSSSSSNSNGNSNNNGSNSDGNNNTGNSGNSNSGNSNGGSNNSGGNSNAGGNNGENNGGNTGGNSGGNSGGNKTPTPEEAEKIYDDAIDKAKTETEKHIIKIAEMSYFFSKSDYGKVISLGEEDINRQILVCDDDKIDRPTRAKCYNLMELSYSYSGNKTMADICGERFLATVPETGSNPDEEEGE